MFSQIEIQHLVTFRTVAELLHFRKASEQLNCSQPVVTRHIKELEEILGFPLLSRNTRNVALLPQGQVFFEHLPKIFEEIETACNRAQAVVDEDLAVLRIGVIGTPAFQFLEDLLSRFKKTSPDVEIRLEEGSSVEIAQQIADGNLDCGVFLSSVEHPRIEQRVVARDQMNFAMADTHPLSRRRSLTFSQLEGQKIILFARERNSALYDLVVSSVPGCSSKQIVESSSRNCAILMAAAGMGIAVIGESMRRICPTSVKAVPLAGENAGVDIVVGWKRGTRNPLEDVLRHL